MSVLSIVVPIFVLVAVGYGAARAGLLSDAAQKGVAEFAFNYAMPALLFRGIVGASPSPAGWWRIAVAYFAAVGVVWLLATLATRLLLRRPSVDAPTIAMTTCFGNVVMIGIPLALAVVGPDAAAPIAVLVALHSPVLWLAATLHQQATGASQGRAAARVAFDLVRDLVRNPLLASIFAGIAWRFIATVTGWQLPHAADASLALLAQAGVPCAQVALGASLTRFAITGQLPTLSLILVLKLLVLPLVVYALVVPVLALPRTAAAVAVIFAAMPAGANAFLFAERTQRVVNSTSGAVALGTVLATITTTLLIANLDWLVGP